VLAFAVLVLLLGHGCGGDAGAETAVVRFWAFGREGELVRRLVPEFEARHPGIRVEVQQIPWTAAHEKLLTAYVGDAVPDVAQLGTTWVPELVALGALAPLDGRIAASAAVVEEDYFPGAWQVNLLDGATWGVPWYVDTRVLFYRTDLVPREGWPPRTWAEWRTAMEEIRRAGPDDRYPVLLPIDEWAYPVVLGMQTGAGLLADGGRRGDFRAPAFRRAMAFYTGLFADGLAPPLDQAGLVNLYQQFADGTYAMVITGPWNLGEFHARLPASMEGRWSTAPLPAPRAEDGYPGASLAGGTSLVLFRHAAQPEAAWRWIEYLSEPAQQARFHELTGGLPARESAWERTGLAEDPLAAAFLAQLRRVEAPPKVPEWERIATRVAQCAEEVVRGSRDLDAALAALDADVDRMLEKRRWLLARQAEEAKAAAAAGDGR
jgi:multiple sugar transport system substrate-binding protein